MAKISFAVLIAAPLVFAGASAFAAENLSATDQTFVREAAAGNMAEVQEAQLAQQKAANAEIKAFASKMVADHTQAQNELQQIASLEKINLPAEPTPAQRRNYTELSRLSGAQFDRKYAQQQVSDHQRTIELFRTEASNGRNQQLKTYAQKTLPILQQHLQMAEGLTRKS
ncbi:MAG: DUF4142 domain-containing protein [Acetobacteraceae bacterium]|nr:DUF4142 domain-containing protein [Acetobacteraceae bacterium]